ncbi:alginate export family protein [Methylophilus aquaticus]|uniref:Alginate export family protein n=1 Tax=Methylophilus aquaticus TaxID=1971610 RepID=A0ABT9JQV0_9PROT|nr:alginate export family protein [Methylophilus aquaticus]MDP8566938.1 alginate export family protein [Methylophilus aquaticus]
MNAKPHHRLRQVSVAGLLAVLSSAAMAEEEMLPEYTFMDAIKTGKNMTSFRLRYENVQQDGLQPNNLSNAANTLNPTRNEEIKDANAVTLRSLIGWQTAPYHNWSFAAQIINVSKLSDDFNDGTNSFRTNGASNQNDKINYAKVVDPDQTDINQLYVDWTGIKNTRVRAGRQQVNLDNVRFIGDIAFRQVMQVFDGVSVFNKTIPDTEIFLAHFEKVNQIFTTERNGNLEIANARYRISPTEFLVGYGYFSNFENLGLGNAWFGAGAANLQADQSNKILGIRLDGTHPFTPNYRAHYTAEYAKQSDYSGGDDRIDAHYYKVGGGFGIDNFNLRVDQELLSSNSNTYAFQTPFGTNHLFQGWVDKFLVTPRAGIKDSFVTATYRYGDFVFFADYHVIDADTGFYTVNGGAGRSGSRYGTEWNAAVTWNVDKNWMTKLEYGKFNEGDQFAAAANTTGNAAGVRGRFHDTEKLWLTAMYTF